MAKQCIYESLSFVVRYEEIETVSTYYVLLLPKDSRANSICIPKLLKSVFNKIFEERMKDSLIERMRRLENEERERQMAKQRSERLQAVRKYLRDERLITGTKNSFYEYHAERVNEGSLDWSGNTLTPKELRTMLGQLVAEKWATKREYQEFGVLYIEYALDNRLPYKIIGGAEEHRYSPSHTGTHDRS
jgi:hypothetical protein